MKRVSVVNPRAPLTKFICSSSRYWSSFGGVFSPSPPPGICFDTQSAEIIAGSAGNVVSLAPLYAKPALGMKFPDRFFSTALSRRPARPRWSEENPVRSSRLFAATCRRHPGLVRHTASMALDLQCFFWQIGGMLLTDLRDMSRGWLLEGLAPGSGDVRVSLFNPEPSGAHLALEDPRATAWFPTAPSAEFVTLRRPHDPSSIFSDEVSGLVMGPGSVPLAVGLPKNPRGRRLSRLSAYNHPGFLPGSATLLGEHLKRGSSPALTRLDATWSMPAISEAWLYMLSHVSPKSSPCLKARCDLAVENYWAVIETCGAPLPSVSANFFQPARMLQLEKLIGAVRGLSSTTGCRALESLQSGLRRFARPSKPAVPPCRRSPGIHL